MAIALRSVAKGFPSKQSAEVVPVLDDIDLDVPEGRIVALFGPNGCGKTTLLNIVAGIERPDTGTVRVDGFGSHPVRLGYVFQNFHEVLLPWKSALDNVAFALRALGVSQTEARERTLAFLDEYDFHFPRHNYPYQLSIGQQQTAALARVLIQNPANILLDEPFAALDHEARFRMQEVAFSALLNEVAVLIVSHDIDEAIYLSDELVLLSRRPARVVATFAVPFSRPRRSELLASSEFTALRRKVIEGFLAEVKA